MLYGCSPLSQPPLAETQSFEDIMDNFCAAQKLPSTVLVADGPGGFHYVRAFGTCVVNGKESTEPLAANATFRLGSCTALMTTIAVLQCVERGLLRLDEDVTQILPELKDVNVLTGFDPRTNRPILVRRRNTLTLRFVNPRVLFHLASFKGATSGVIFCRTHILGSHLLTHTSGLTHDHFSPFLRRYLLSQSRIVPTPPSGKIKHTYRFPLIFEPGTSWAYGVGIDWAGLMVERVNSNISLQDYMERDIWAPLAISTATFRLDNRPDLKERLPGMTCRQGLIHPLFGTTMSPMGNIVRDHSSTAVTESTVTELSSDDDNDELSSDNDDFGGCGVYCSAPDFAKLLSSLCNTSHYPVLRPSTVNLMFSPQLTSVPAKTQLHNLTRIPEVRNIFGALPLHQHPPLDLDWGFGGMLVLDDIWGVSKFEQSMAMAMDRVLPGLGPGHPGKTSSNEQQQARRTKSRGTMFSGGTTNLYWWVDRAAGVSGVWASQLVPVGDPWTVKMIGEFEGMVYEQVRVRGASMVHEELMEQRRQKERE